MHLIERAAASAVFLLLVALIVKNKWEIDELRNKIGSQCACVDTINNTTVVQNGTRALHLTWPSRFFSGIGQNMTFTGGTLFTERNNMDVGPYMYPAVASNGSMYVDGTLVVKRLLVEDPRMPGNYKNLTRLLEIWRYFAGEVCLDQRECVHGWTSPNNCSCICDQGWYGVNCTKSLCNGHGTWSADADTCVCDGAYSVASLCFMKECGSHGAYSEINDVCDCDFGWEGDGCDVRTPKKDCDPGVCQGFCEDDTCFCTNAQFGPNCEYDCASTAVNYTLCPYRMNWGIDMPCYQTSESWDDPQIICVCGGGYQFGSDTLGISQMNCNGSTTSVTECQDTFAREAPICCAPGVDCNAIRQVCGASDGLCCASGHNTDQDTCFSLGCQWCSAGRWCIPTGVQSTGCTSPNTANITGSWLTFSFDCNGNEGACNNLARTRYLDIYEECMSGLQIGLPPLECLAEAHTKVQTAAWPELDVFKDMDDYIRHHISAVTHPLSTCVSGSPLLAIQNNPSEAGLRASPARWECSEAVPFSRSAFYFKLSDNIGTVDSTVYNVLITADNGNEFCLMRGPPTLAERAQYFRDLGVDYDYYFVNLKEAVSSSSYIPSYSFCTPFVVENSTIVNVDGVGMGIPSSVPELVTGNELSARLSLGYYSQRIESI